MAYMIMSALLRTEIRSQMGRPALEAIQDHMYHKGVGEFDPMAHWETMDVLRLSELAHRLRDYAEKMDSTNPLKIEAMRFAKTIWNDFSQVYKIAMQRIQPATWYDGATS